MKIVIILLAVILFIWVLSILKKIIKIVFGTLLIGVLLVGFTYHQNPQYYYDKFGKDRVTKIVMFLKQKAKTKTQEVQTEVANYVEKN